MLSNRGVIARVAHTQLYTYGRWQRNHAFRYHLRVMSDAGLPVAEGVFAINKPPSLSSAEVIRKLQHVFDPSNLFAPWIQAEKARREERPTKERRKRRNKHVQVKMGHGGTLDPMATGVLILGIGKGTKKLQNFLECTKSYEATVVFGAATDTYDILGKVVQRAPYQHVTRARVTEALSTFRGEIMQRPPIYSALHMDGKRLYEYAREGKAIPREIEKRSVQVTELEIIDWYEGSTHGYRISDQEADPQMRELAATVMHHENEKSSAQMREANIQRKEKDLIGKRKRPPDDVEDEAVTNKKPTLLQEAEDASTLMSGALQRPKHKEGADNDRQDETAPFEGAEIDGTSDVGPPAVKLRMTVTSGFYVRSLAHDLGEAVGSLACMSSLIRTRQGNYELGRNVLQYADTEGDEGTWAPKLQRLLQESENT